MKLLSKLAFIILFFYGQFVAAQNLEDFKKIEVAKYSFKPTKEFKLLTVQSPFGSSQLSNVSILDSLKDKKVASVRLVYTKYRESESFNQEQLNKKRVANLVASNPKLFSNAGIKWYRVEQTTEDSFQAKSLFHGFYILYQNKPPQRDYAISDKLLNANGITTQVFKIENSKENVITGKEGTKIRIQPNCFLDENKKPYKGEVKMEVKEAITMESIILGNLVTMADGNALESAGMIYIDAKTADGKALTLNSNKPLEVSLPAKEVKPDMKLWEAENNGKFMNWKNPKILDNQKKSENNLSPVNGIGELEFDRISVEQTDRYFQEFYTIEKDYGNPIVWSLSMINFRKEGYFDYYILHKDGRITARIIRKIGNQKATIIKDTTYDSGPFHNKKIALPLPSIDKKYSLGSIYFENNKFNWNERIGLNMITQNDIKDFYKFNLTEIGRWANIDCFAIDARTKPVTFFAGLTENDKFESISMYLIFKDRKVFIPGFKSNLSNGYGFSHGDFEISRLPVGAKATLLSVAYKEEKPYIAFQDVIISEKQFITLKPFASSEEGIKKLIKDNF